MRRPVSEQHCVSEQHPATAAISARTTQTTTRSERAAPCGTSISRSASCSSGSVCSARSTRLERWLLEHPRFGPRLVAWREHHVIPLAVKLTAYTSMAVSLTVLGIAQNWWAFGSAAAVMAIGVAYISTRPSRPPAPSPAE
jgi:Protein of unknown function (DUF454)